MQDMCHSSCKLLALLALVCMLGPSAVSGEEQLRAIFMFKGPCYPVADAAVQEIVAAVVNPITGASWGNPIQADSHDSLCSQLPQGCDPAAASGGAATPVPVPAAPAGTPTPAAPTTPPPAVPIPAVPIDYDYSSIGTDYGFGAAGEEFLSNRRRLLACEDGEWHLALDAATVTGADAVLQPLADSVTNGQFMEMLGSTSVAADSVELVSAFAVPPAAPVPPADPTGAMPAVPADPMAAAPVDAAATPAPAGEATNSTSGTTGSSGGSKKILIIALIAGGAVAVVAVAAVTAIACCPKKKRSPSGRVSKAYADYMVHQWQQEREAVSAYRSKLAMSKSGERQTVLDMSAARSAPAEFRPIEKKGGFLGLFGSRS